MIEKLTPEQEAKLSEFRDRWLNVGLDVAASNRKSCEEAIRKIYKNAGFEPPAQMLWVKSPREAITKAGELLKKETGQDADPQQIFNNFCYGAHEASWLSFYSFCMEVLSLDECKPLEPYMEVAMHCGWWLPYDTVCIISEKPVVIHLNDRGLLHKDGGPAIAFGDGFAVWGLNGVRVPQDIAETAWDKIPMEKIIQEKNAEVRREVVRKVGVERIIKETSAEVIDKEGDYELLLLDIGDKRMRPYLKMLNPSIGTYHIEGVPVGTKTVAEAKKFRNGTDEQPVSLT